MGKSAKYLIFSLFALISFGGVSVAQSIRYDFDEVEVRYAAEFTARSANVDPGNWIVQIAGGVDQPITVLYGVVNLKRGGENQLVEEFIRVSGQGGSERFLLNSAVYNYYEGTTNYRDIKSFFWSAKKLVDNSVVKDFTPPIKSINLHRTFSASQQINSIQLSFSSNGEQAAAEFWSSLPTENLYGADSNAINQSGVPTATAAQ
ncbi:hypothetical protein HYV91_02610 [Candidatus Wolfebacteria bacterium]|nr:hypothetical protein [Candidatus Wolfebacteria bacterium]